MDSERTRTRCGNRKPAAEEKGGIPVRACGGRGAAAGRRWWRWGKEGVGGEWGEGVGVKGWSGGGECVRRGAGGRNGA